MFGVIVLGYSARFWIYKILDNLAAIWLIHREKAGGLI